ncbi:MAG: hypothetical protein LQ352_000029 [Teloschistes flavicans]|nr:MAG: hypothetical protein LQ352_000029 [Teloschistes flavicans]
MLMRYATGQEKQKKLLAADAGHFSMIKYLLSLPSPNLDKLTMMNKGTPSCGLDHRTQWYRFPDTTAAHRLQSDHLNPPTGFCGFMSILSSMRYCLGPSTSYGPIWFALAFMPFGLFFDFMDGKVARWRQKSSLMGQELDSLADLVSFGVSPAVAAFALGLRTPVDTLLLSFFVLCGLTRLARFNVTVSSLPKDATGKSKYFEGTPIPSSLCIVGAMAWFYDRHAQNGKNDTTLGRQLQPQ